MQNAEAREADTYETLRQWLGNARRVDLSVEEQQESLDIQPIPVQFRYLPYALDRYGSPGEDRCRFQ